MREEYNFADAEQGKFYRPDTSLQIPIYLEDNISVFYTRRAEEKQLSLDAVINLILSKEMEIIKEIELKN